MLNLEKSFPGHVVAVVQSADPEAAFRACVAAVEGGVGALEVTMNVPDAIELARGVAASTGVPVGVGGVVDARTVRQAKKARVAFVATPFMLQEVAYACQREGVFCVLGALTPSEVQQAGDLRAGMVEVFPVQSVGGPSYIRWLRAWLPDLPLWVSGGVEIQQVSEYLRAGVSVVGLDTALFPPDALRRGDFSAVRELARRATTAATTAPL